MKNPDALHPSKGGTANPQDLLGSADASFLERMSTRYDLIVLDAPPSWLFRIRILSHLSIRRSISCDGNHAGHRNGL